MRHARCLKLKKWSWSESLNVFHGEAGHTGKLAILSLSSEAGDEAYLYVVPAILLLWEAVRRAKRPQTASRNLPTVAASLCG